MVMGMVTVLGVVVGMAVGEIITGGKRRVG